MDETATAAPPCACRRWQAGTPCGEPSIAVMTVACLHEHVEAVRCCAGCAVEAQVIAPDAICTLCHEGPEPHECSAVVIIEWDSGERTVVQEGASRG